MGKSSDKLERAVNAASSKDMRALLAPRTDPLTLVDVMDLTRRLELLDEARVPVRLAILHTYTSELLDPYLTFEASLQGLALATYHAPYGAILQEAQTGSALRRHAPDVVLLLLQWEDLDPALTRPLALLDADGQRELATAVVEGVTRLASALGTAGGHLVITVLPRMSGPGLGTYDTGARNSEAAWRARVKADIAGRLATTSVTFLDLDEVALQIGRRTFFDARLWYTSRFPFTVEAAQQVARKVVAVAAAATLPRAKVIAIDADNTLWGGIVGEDGLNGIALGPDYPGNAYRAFQLRLLEYQQRGFLLALCSKNNLEDVLQVLRQHPHQVLREEHFAAMRINWEPKVASLQAIAEELNLGLESFVFVDDSDYECLAVRRALPMVEVVQVPGRALDVPGCLEAVARLEVLTVTAEDRRRTEMYVHERRRREIADAAPDLDSYLRSLEMRMAVGVDDVEQVARIAQLTQKTNQFNLTTRRYATADIRRMMEAPEWLVAHFSLADIFGDSGLVGVVLARLTSAETAELDSVLMSCRVIGRKAETVFLQTVLSLVRARGARTVLADYLPTAKNQLVEKFLAEHGFTLRADGRYTRDLTAGPDAGVSEIPIAVAVNGEPQAIQ